MARRKSSGLTRGDAKTECERCGLTEKIKKMKKIDGKYYHKFCVDEE